MKSISIATSLFRTMRFLINLSIKEGLHNPFKNIYSLKENPLFLLANGPSLKSFFNDLDNNPNSYISKDYMVVNDFVKDPHFDLLQPKYCVMSDPLFFIETIYSQRGHKVMDTLGEKVKWPLILFIPYVYTSSTFLEPIRRNENISIIAFHSNRYYGYEKMRNYIYKLGLGNGEFGTVALNAIYSAIMIGYKTIYCYGLDHTFFDNLAVNDNNELCYRDTHFYGSDNVLKPMLNHYHGTNIKAKPFRVSEFLQEKADIFKGHEIMNKFAKYIGVKIYNCTPLSMVDEYERFRPNIYNQILHPSI